MSVEPGRLGMYRYSMIAAAPPTTGRAQTMRSAGEGRAGGAYRLMPVRLLASVTSYDSMRGRTRRQSHPRVWGVIVTTARPRANPNLWIARLTFC